MIDFSATVAAIATPPGKGGVALIRVTGPEAFAVADKCFRPSRETPLSLCPPRTAVRGDIVDGEEVVDDGLALLFPAPHSYTGEDTVEITCHGGLLVTRTVLEVILSAGARLASAGEFTRRAYMNGTLSLTEAEGIGSLLEATSRGQLRLSARESRSRLSLALSALHEELVLVMASLYATIDYPEEDLAQLSREDLTQRLTEAQRTMRALLATYKTGRTIAEGIPTVICGRPNVGKSSLYNLLCCEDAAIVTDVAGTTRDVLERTVALGDLTLHLSDTAGIHETEDLVERIGVERSRAKIEESQLVFAVFDASEALTDEDLRLIDALRGTSATVVAILNKWDLPHADMQAVKDAFSHVLTLSAKTGDTAPLALLVRDLFTDGAVQIGQDAILSNARQYASLATALEQLTYALEALAAGVPADVACGDLEAAIGSLSMLDGREVSQEVVDRIFSHFCVGK